MNRETTSPFLEFSLGHGELVRKILLGVLDSENVGQDLMNVLLSCSIFSKCLTDRQEMKSFLIKKVYWTNVLNEDTLSFSYSLRSGKKCGWLEKYKNVDGQKILIREGRLKNGLKQGIWSYFHADGWLTKRGRYMDGFKEDTWLFWYDQHKDNNRPYLECEYKRGQAQILLQES